MAKLLENGTYDYEDFKRLYKVRVPTIATYSTYELEEFGMYNNYDSKGNSFVLNSKTPETTLNIKSEPYLNVYRIIDIHAEGYAITFLEDNERLKEFYNILDGYLGYCESLTSLSLHKVEIGDKGLYDKASNFIKEIYGINRKTIERSLLDTTASGFDLGMGLLGKVTINHSESDYEGIQFNMPDPNTWR